MAMLWTVVRKWCMPWKSSPTTWMEVRNPRGNALSQPSLTCQTHPRENDGYVIREVDCEISCRARQGECVDRLRAL